MSNTFKRYLSTKEVCDYLSCSRSFLNERKDKVFFKGIHYFTPEKNFLRWDRFELDKWLKSHSFDDKKVNEILKNIL